MSSDYLKVTFLDGSINEQTDRQNYKHRITPFANSEIYFAPIQSAEKLTQGQDAKTVYKLSLDLKNVKYEFLPGDTIGILPPNNEKIVEELLIRLNINSVADNPCILEISPETTKRNPTVPKHLPSKITTLRKIFQNHVDIFTPPKKIFLKTLTKFITSPEEKEKLHQICSPKSSKEYTDLITTSGRSFLGLLDTFPSCQPSVEAVLEHLPALLPRPYSISSSPLCGDSLDVTFFILEHDDGRKGVCTGWLENLIKNSANSPIPFYFRQPNSFRLPENPVPMIMVATGTGIAPFRSFLHHISLSEKKSEPIWLFYGCRYSNRDFLYKNEIENYLKCNILSTLDIAFSREGVEKVYVQDSIDKKGAEFIDWLLKKDAVMYLCGNFKTVVKDVKAAVVRNLIKYGGMSESDAEYFVQEMESRKKLIVDTWT